MDRTDRRFSGWGLVTVASLAMGTAGIYQFSWSSLRLPLGTRLGAPEPALGTVFTLFVVFQTLGQFPAGWVRDRYGPQLPLVVGAVCLAGGFAGLGLARSLPMAYLAYAVGGFGVSITYTVSINTAVKWFDDRRGLATGLVSMSFGAISFLVIPAIRAGVAEAFEQTVFILAVGIGSVSLLGAAILRDPSAPAVEGLDVDDEANAGVDADDEANAGVDADDEADAGVDADDEADAGVDADDEADAGVDADDEANAGVDADDEANAGVDADDEADAGADMDVAGGSESADSTAERAWTWRETVRTWQFWLLYVVFIVVNGVGLMVIGKVVSFATELSLPAVVVTAIASLVALTDAGGVLVGGALSDRLGRSRTVAVSLVLSGVALAGAVAAGLAGFAAGFAILIAATTFFRSPPLSVFPSIVADYYGRAYSSENYAVLYTAKLFGGILGGSVASGLVVSISWTATFALGAGLIALAGAALGFLRPVEAADRPVAGR
jgi:OFA family oxalate/formate antiporter-like MFS transporter